MIKHSNGEMKMTPSTEKTAKKTSFAEQVAKCGQNIPAFLKRKKNDVKDVTPMPTSFAVVKQQERERSLDMPKGFEGTKEEFEAMKRELDPRETKKEEKKQEFFKKEKKQRVPRAEAPAGTFKLSAWAKDAGLDPRIVRRAARTIKGELSKLYVNGMKYVFADASKDAVAKMIREAQANESKKTIKIAKKKAPKLPPPSDATWSGKAARVKASDAPKTVDPKKTARKEAKEAVRTLKRAVKENGGNKEKAVKKLKKIAVREAKKAK